MNSYSEFPLGDGSETSAWTLWNISRGGYWINHRAEAALLWSQAERAGCAQPGEEECGETLEPLRMPKATLREMERVLDKGLE